jgi:hypothetical protein
MRVAEVVSDSLHFFVFAFVHEASYQQPMGAQHAGQMQAKMELWDHRIFAIRRFEIASVFYDELKQIVSIDLPLHGFTEMVKNRR